MIKTILSAACVLLLAGPAARAQCNILPTATAGTQAFATASTAPNPMAFVYNPGRALYYCVFGGSAAYPVEVFNTAGTRLTSVTPLGADFRGMWWNAATAHLEGNTYNNTELLWKPLDASGYPVATTVNTIFSSGNGLSIQNVAAFDPVNNEIIYYSAGTIKRVNRATNATITSGVVTGLPVAAGLLNPNVVLYTGCASKEYALYNPTSKALYFVARATLAYVGTSQLPATAPSGNNTFGLAYTNNQLYVYNYTTRIWNNYTVFSSTPTATADPANVAAPKLTLLPNPAREQVRVVGATGPLRLLDTTGRIVREQSGTDVLSLTGLPAGIYLVRSGTRTVRLCIE